MAQRATPVQAAGTFSTTASASLVNIAPGGSQTISWSVQSNTATTVALSMGVYNSAAVKVSQQNLTYVDFTAGQTRTYSYTWVAPSNEKLGTHSVQVGVFSPDWSTTYIWNSTAAQFGVLNPTFTSTATISPSSISPGATETINWSVQSATSITAAVALGIYDPAGTKVGVQNLSNEVFVAGQSKTYTFTWQAPAAAVLGTYSVQVGAFSADWATSYVWNTSAAQFGVITNAPPPNASPAYIASASVPVINISPGTSQTISWSVQSNTATTLSLAVGVYDPSGAKVGQQNLAKETFWAGQTKSFTYTWTAPANEKLGAHSVQIGVLSADWATTYAWNTNAAQFGVLNPTFTSTATISPSSITPGATETINWSVQSATSITAAVALGIYDPAGTKVGVQNLSNEVFVAGQSKTYTFTWQAPAAAVLGTYPVQVGAFSADWATTYVWNTSAAQFGVTSTAPPTTPGYASSASVSPVNVNQGASSTVNWTVQSNTATTVSIAMGVYDANGTKVAQQNMPAESFWAGQYKSYTYAWNVAAAVPLGTYTVEVGIYSPDWSKPLAMNTNAGFVRVVGTTAAGGCSPALQLLIDTAAAGSTLTVPACVYREAVIIDKPLTLIGQPGTEVRGSDIWTNWTQNGQTWTHRGLPALRGTAGTCTANADCTWLGQLYIDGTPLAHVSANPASGQWASDASGNVVLADDPSGRTVEVSTRSSWVSVSSDNVAIQGFTMQHLANEADTGGVMSTHVNNLKLQHNTFAYAHGASVFLRYGSGHQVLDNDIHDAGQVGVEAYVIDTSLISRNLIHANATAGYSISWGAAAVKIAQGTNVTLDSNTVYGNGSHGLWCDVACRDITFSNNRVYDNAAQGIHFEVSNGAKIFGNVVWNNSIPGGGGWGAGIYVSSSSNAEVYNNTVFATRAHGIYVVSQNRTDYPSSNSVTNNYIHDNTVIMNGLYNGNIGRTALGWIQDWSSNLYDDTSNNRSSNNAFWFSYPEASWQRFNWNSGTGGQWTMADFTQTRGGSGSYYLTDAQRDQVISAANIPASAWSE